MKRVQEAVHAFELFRKNDTVLLAVSGGPDSTALFHLFIRLREKSGLRLAVAHVNYRLRGKDSDKDELFVRELCKQQDIPVFVSRPKDATGKNEEGLREIRYRFFETVRKRLAFNLIATAHTQDDQAETVLLRLLRGAGTAGLSAIRPKNGPLIRPLIGISKADLLQFLREEHLPFRLDKTNRDTRILRNRIRHELIPLLEKKYQPAVRSILARTALVLAEETNKRESVRFPLPVTSVTGGVSFSRKHFRTFSDTDQSGELRRLFREVSETGKNPPQSFVKEVKKMLGSKKNKIQSLTVGQLKMEAKDDTVVMIKL